MGEVTLAHNGILFLDELGEFKPAVIQSLREPMEEGKISVSRVDMAVSDLTWAELSDLLKAVNDYPDEFSYFAKNRFLSQPP